MVVQELPLKHVCLLYIYKYLYTSTYLYCMYIDSMYTLCQRNMQSLWSSGQYSSEMAFKVAYRRHPANVHSSVKSYLFGMYRVLPDYLGLLLLLKVERLPLSVIESLQPSCIVDH
jgi:hypothetical protein